MQNHGSYNILTAGHPISSRYHTGDPDLGDSPPTAHFAPPRAHSRRSLWRTPCSYLNFLCSTTLPPAATSCAQLITLFTLILHCERNIREICAKVLILPLLVLTAAATSGEPQVPTSTSYLLQLRRRRQPRTRGGSHGGGRFTQGGAESCSEFRIASLLMLTAAAASGEPQVLTPTFGALQLRPAQQPRPRSVSHALRPRRLFYLLCDGKLRSRAFL